MKSSETKAPIDIVEIAFNALGWNKTPVNMLREQLQKAEAVVEAAREMNEHVCFGHGSITMMDGSSQPCGICAALTAYDEASK